MESTLPIMGRRIEEESGGFSSIHNQLMKPFQWWGWRMVVCLSPEQGWDDSSFAYKAWETTRKVAEMVILSPIGVISTSLAVTSFVIKKAVQLVSGSTITPFGRLYDHPEHWSSIKANEVDFPEDMIFGAGTCDYQCRGPNVPDDNPALYGPLKQNPDQDAQWSSFDKAKLDDAIANYISKSLWHDIPCLIRSMKKIGISSIRISPPESLYPSEDGSFNEIAIGRMKEILEELHNNNISVSLTGFHFTMPKYVADSGGYLVEENCDRFISYMERMFEEFHPYVRSWCTINEPAVFAMQTYGRAVHANGELDFQKMGQLMVNLLKLHNRCYVALKEKAKEHGIEDTVIGFSHDVIHFKPHNSWNPLEQVVTWFLTHAFHKAYLDFYKTGVFELSIPIPAWLSFLAGLFGVKISKGVHLKHEDPDLEKNNKYMDRIFLQCYTIPEIEIGLTGAGPYKNPHLYQPPWDTPADPFALYRGIRDVYEATGKDVEVTEFGCPVPTHVEEEEYLQHRAHQAIFIERAFYAMDQAIKDGYPLKAIYIWSLLGDKNGRWWEWDYLTDIQFNILDAKEKDGFYGMTPAAERLESLITRRREKHSVAQTA